MPYRYLKFIHICFLFVSFIFFAASVKLDAASFKISDTAEFAAAGAIFNDVVASDTAGVSAGFLRLKNRNPGEDDGSPALKFGGRGVWARKRQIAFTIPDDFHTHTAPLNRGKAQRINEKVQVDLTQIGNARPDWSDLRLTDWAGNQIPFRLLDFERPTDNATTPVKLLFEANAHPSWPPASNTYHLYYMNPEALSVEDKTLSQFYINNHDFEEGLTGWSLCAGVTAVQSADGLAVLAAPNATNPTMGIETGISIIPVGYTGFDSNACLSIGYPEGVNYPVGAWRAYEQTVNGPSTGTYILTAQRRFTSASFTQGWYSMLLLRTTTIGRDRRYFVSAGFSDWTEASVDFTPVTTRDIIPGLGMWTSVGAATTLRERRSQFDWAELKLKYPLDSLMNGEETAGYAVTGVYESKVFDTGVANPVFESLTWSANTTAPGTSVIFQTRTAAAAGGPYSAWSSVISINGSAIESPANRYIQVRAILSTDDTSFSPILNEIEVFYRLPVAGFRVDVPATAGAGDYFDFRVTAVDQNNATVTGFIGNVVLTADSPTVEFPRNSHSFTSFDNGTTVFQARNPVAEIFRITATSGMIASDSLPVQTLPGLTVSLGLQAFPAAVTAGSLFSGQIVARDRYGNIDTANNGQILVQTTDIAPASFPGSVNLANGVVALTDCAFFTVPSQRVQVKEASSGIASYQDILVNAGVATKLRLTAEPDQYQNTPFNLVIAAVDNYGNLNNGVNTTFSLSSSLGTVSPVAGNIVAGLSNQPVTLDTSGNLTLTALTATALTGELGLNVHPAVPPSLNRFVVDAGYYQLAGVPFTLTIEARDLSDNVLTSYDGACRIIPSVGACSPPMTTGYKFLDGFLAIPISLSGASDNVILRVEDVKDSSKIGLLFLNVRPSGLAEFEIITPPAADAGATFTFTIRARDNQGNLLTNYTGTAVISHTATGGDASLPVSYTFTSADAGVKVFSGANGARFTKAENIKIRVEDSGKVGISDFVSINADDSDPVVELRPDLLSIDLGTSLSFDLNLKDRFGNQLDGFTGTVNFSYSDPTVVGPANYTFQDFENGYKRFLLAVTPTDLGNFTITATDALSGNSVTTDMISVVSGETINFALSPDIVTLVAGQNFSFNVTASNSAGNLNEQYNGGIRFTTLDSQALIPQDSTLVNGQGTFQATYFTAGGYQLSVFDIANPAISGNMAVSVQASAPRALEFELPTLLTEAGIAVAYRVKVVDAFGNPVNYTGNVAVSSTDKKASSTPSQVIVFANQANYDGLWTFTTAGSQRLMATSAGLSETTSLPILVDAGPANSITGDFPTAASSELVNPFSVRVIDQYGNPTPQFTQAINITQAGGFNFSVSPSPYTFSSADNGAKTFFLRWDYGTANAPSNVTVTFTPNPIGSVANGAITHVLRVDNPRNAAAEFPYLRSWLSLPDRQVVASEPFQMIFKSFSIRETDVDITSRIDFSISDGTILVSRDGVNYSSSIDVAGESSVTFWAIVSRTGFLSMLATPQIAPTQKGSVSFMSHPGPVSRITLSADSPQKAGAAFPWTAEWWDNFDNYARRATESIDLSAVAAGNVFLDPKLLILSGRTGRFNQDENRSWLTDDFIIASATSNLRIDPTKQQISIKGLYDEDFSSNLKMSPAGIWKAQRVGLDGQALTVVVFDSVGNHSFTPPAGITSVDYLVVAGGGGGGAWYGGGGGAGGMRSGTLAVTPGVPVAITVGDGGAGAPGGTNNSPGSSGQNSSFGAIVSTGGGGGGTGANGNNAGRNGGSGGGAGGGDLTAPQGPGGTGTAGQGNNGSTGRYNNTANRRAGGGGGGAGAAGGASPGNGQGGAGGVGLQNNISGASLFYAGGGGGAGDTSAGAGGNGGGGAGSSTGNGNNGAANTGGGGGAAAGGINSARRGGDGGSGIVIIRYSEVLPADTFSVLNDQLEMWTVGDGSLSTHPTPAATGAGAGVNWYEHSDDSYFYLYFDWPANDIFAFEATLAIRRIWYDMVLEYSPYHAGLLMRDDSSVNRPRFVSAMLRRVDNGYANNREIGVFFVQSVYRVVPGIIAPYADNTRRFRRRFTTDLSIANTHPMWVRLVRNPHTGTTPGRFYPQACHDGQSWRLLDSSGQAVAATTNPHPDMGVNLTKLGISIGAGNATRPARAFFDEFRVNRYPQAASFTSVVYDIGTSSVTLTNPLQLQANFNSGNVRLFFRGSNNASAIAAQPWTQLPLAVAGAGLYNANPSAFNNRRYIQYSLVLDAHIIGTYNGETFYDATPFVNQIEIGYTPADQGALFEDRNVEPPAAMIASFSDTITSQTDVEILGGVADHLEIVAPATVTAGVPFTITVRALDTFGNIADDYNKTWSFTTSDVAPFLGLAPGDYTLVPAADAGQHTFYNASILYNGPTSTITVTDGTLTAVSPPIAVNPGRIGAFSLFALSPQTAGTVFPLLVTALDIFNNVKTDYSASMAFSDNRTGGSAVYNPPALAAGSWLSGLATLTPGVYFTKAETINVTGQSSYRSGVSNAIEIGNATPASLLMSVTTTSPNSGIPFSVTVRALDEFGNIARNYVGQIRFSCNDTHPSVLLPPDYQFVAGDAGEKIFTSQFVLITPGPVMLQVVDTVNATMTHQFPLSVLPGPATRFDLSCNATQTAGVPFNLLIKVYDDYGNLKTNFSETVSLLTAFETVMPVSAGGFSNGQLLVPSVELNDSGLLPAENTIACKFGSVYGDRLVNLLPPSTLFERFDLETVPAEPTVGDAFKLVVKAVGPDGAVYTNYNGTGVFLEARNSLDQLVDPPMAPAQASGFTNGVKELYARNWVAGDITLWATDKTMSDKIGSLTVSFKPTNLSHFSVVPGTSTVEPFANNYFQTVNASFPLFLVAYDTIGNIKTDYSGTVHLSENGPGSLSSSTVVFVDGVATLSAVYYDQPGKIRITATDNILGRSGFSGTLQFFGPLHRFNIAVNTHQTDETPFPLQLSAIDIYDQEKLNFTGNVTSQRISWSLGPLADVTLTPAAPSVAWEEAKSYTWLSANRPDTGAIAGDFGFRIISDTWPDASGSAIISLHRASALAVTGFAIETFSPQQAGKPFPMLIKAVDASGAVVKTWTATDAALNALATLGFNSDILPAAIPAAEFVDGVYATTTAQIATPGTYTVSVNSGGLGGSFSPLLVKPGAASALRITVPDYAPLNADFVMTVAAISADGQVKTDFIPDGPIQLKLNATSTGYLGVQFINPEDFVDGEAKILDQTYNKSQEIYISAIDNVTGMRDTGGPIKVFGPPVKLVLEPLPTASSDFFWNNWFKVKVTIKDVNGYPVANFSGDIDFAVAPGTGSAASDAAIIPALVTQLLESDSLGSQEFYLKVTYATLQSPTLLDIEATSAADGLSDTANDLRFIKEPRFDSFEILSPANNGTVYKGKPFNFRVRAIDNFGNPWPLLASYPSILVENVDPLSLSSFSALPSGSLEFLNSSEVIVQGQIDYEEQLSAMVRYSIVPEDNLLAGDFVEFKVSTGFNLKDSIYQKIATETFALPSRYILSAFISPGTGSAELKFTLIDANGDPKSSFGAKIASDGALMPIGPVAYAGKSEVLLDSSIAHPDHQTWYRVYLAFDYQFDQNVASETIIHLQNSTPAGYTASTTAYFDGIQLEKAFFADQTAPTAYSGSGVQIFSPNTGRSVSGENEYFEW